MMHKVTIGRDSSLYGLEKDMFGPGEKVEFYVYIATDTDYRITSSQVKIIQGEFENHMRMWYSFIMPDEDVTVEIDSRNSMNRLDPEKTVSGRKHRILDRILAGLGKKEDSELRCPECGTEVEEGQKFCHECGCRLIEEKDPR